MATIQHVMRDDLKELSPEELYRVYMDKQVNFGMAAKAIDERREQKRLFLPAAEAPLMAWGPGRHHIMSPELGFDIYSFHLFMEHVAPRTEQAQTKTSGDAIRHYLAGRGVEAIGDQRIDVKEGGFSCIPAGSRHETLNPYAERLRFLCWQQIPGTYLQVHTPYLPA